MELRGRPGYGRGMTSTDFSFPSSTTGVERGDGQTKQTGYRINNDPEEEFFSPFVRQFGPTEIDDGPFSCDVVTCMRITGFRTQEALDRHKRLFH